jgi:dTDP-4-amino-4,6-dideoxygalactose transaminase
MTSGVRAVVAVDQYGCEADVSVLRQAIASDDVLIVHDVAASFGLASGGPVAGTARVASMHASKVFGVGEGGLVLTADAELAARVRYLRSPGALAVRGIDPPRGWEAIPGYSARMSDLDAALARARAPRVGARIDARVAIADEYRRMLDGLGHARAALPSMSRHAFACFPVLLEDGATRRCVADAAVAGGLVLERGHRPQHDRGSDRCPVAEGVAELGVYLPTSGMVDPAPYASLILDVYGSEDAPPLATNRS